MYYYNSSYITAILIKFILRKMTIFYSILLHLRESTVFLKQLNSTLVGWFMLIYLKYLGQR